MRTSIATLLIFLFSFGIASAARLDPSQSHLEGGPLIVPVSTITGNDSGEHRPMPATGTAAPTMRGPMMQGDGMMHGSSTSGMQQMHPPMHGVPGIVTSVGSSSFTIALPGNREHATTTVTVNVTSATTYMRASSTAAFSDLSAGSRVEVIGQFSTSTKSVAATRVMIQGDMKKHEEPKKGFGGILMHIKDFFSAKHDGATDAERRGGPAAVVTSGIVGSLLNTVFSWL